MNHDAYASVVPSTHMRVPTSRKMLAYPVEGFFLGAKWHTVEVLYDTLTTDVHGEINFYSKQQSEISLFSPSGLPLILP